MALGLVLASVGVASGQANVAPAQPQAPRLASWSSLGRGMEHLALEHGAIHGHAFRFAITDVALRIVPAPDGRARVGELTPSGDAVAINASFFDPDGKAMGLAIDRGRSVGGVRLDAWSALVVRGGRSRIVRGAALARDTDADLVVQGLPRLVVGGAVPKLKPQRASRTAVCAAGPSLVLIVTTTRVDAGEVARFLAAAPGAGGLGCRDALNLDGGSSTQLRARWNGFAADIAGGWGVPNALVVTPK